MSFQPFQNIDGPTLTATLFGYALTLGAMKTLFYRLETRAKHLLDRDRSHS